MPPTSVCWPSEAAGAVLWVRAQPWIGSRRLGTVLEVAETDHGAGPAVEVLGVSLG